MGIVMRSHVIKRYWKVKFTLDSALMLRKMHSRSSPSWVKVDYSPDDRQSRRNAGRRHCEYNKMIATAQSQHRLRSKDRMVTVHERLLRGRSNV
ncbi:hypothetical protein Bind_3809 (plasmid) [Beijerinckia indica subsp. indica ATCC 9039]|uniref:Uncharacterized protein n=1 Tax=Beijerinckia indica subsp. indica (strain ATCC 9039 / DSM 1715 / NCIMB 8712) TaxID=395963 RepID=B2ILF0_BEII9|nr:hypothetical protein Bind_3809 [Beijerinckia indica subsp. indica ATCC 9039]